MECSLQCSYIAWVGCMEDELLSRQQALPLHAASGSKGTTSVDTAWAPNNTASTATPSVAGVAGLALLLSSLLKV